MATSTLFSDLKYPPFDPSIPPFLEPTSTQALSARRRSIDVTHTTQLDALFPFTKNP
jgi:hypothetical protein